MPLAALPSLFQQRRRKVHDEDFAQLRHEITDKLQVCAGAAAEIDPHSAFMERKLLHQLATAGQEPFTE